MTLVTVTGFRTRLDLTPASGYVTFTPRVGHILVMPGGPIELGTVKATLDKLGKFSIQLQASDDPNINPTGWTYEVREVIIGATARVYDITVPIALAGTGPNSGLNLDIVGPVETAAGAVQLTPGPVGPQGIQGIQGDPATNFITSVDGRTGIVVLSSVYDALGAAAAVTATKGLANGIVPLDGNVKIPITYLPPLAIGDAFPVASQAAMLALTAERGDIAIRSDLNKSFILSADTPTVLAAWLELKTPTDAVLSVNGRTGVISLSDLFDAAGAAAAVLVVANAAYVKPGTGIPLGDLSAGVTATLAKADVAALGIATTVITSSATPAINLDTSRSLSITALATPITSMSSGLSGTPHNFDKLIVRIKDDGSSRSITWGASFESAGAFLPTSTVPGKRLSVGLIYDSVSTKWGCVASAQEA